MELVLVELDVGAELDATECSEVAGAKLTVARTSAVAVIGGWSAAATEGTSLDGGRAVQAESVPRAGRRQRAV
jgi:hypothetical protein